LQAIIDRGQGDRPLKDVPIRIVEHPSAPPFMLHLLAAFAEEERRLISERTKAALQAAKLRGRYRRIQTAARSRN